MASEEQVAILKKGVENWNRWREQNQDVQIDLKGVDLSNTDLQKVNFAQARLQGANLSFSSLRNANLTFAHLQNANLAHASLERSNLSHVHMEKANLSFASLKRAMLPFAHLAEAKLSAANLRWVRAEDADFRGANLSYAHMEGAILAFSDFSNAHLVGVHMEGVNIRAADFSNSNVSLVKFDQKVFWKILWASRWKPATIWKRRYDFLLDTTLRCKGINSSTCYGSQRFKRFIQDQDYLEETLETAWGKRRFVFWWIFADCGRSLSRWTGWSLAIALLFAYIYWMLGPEHMRPSALELNFTAAVYCSFGIFTTLGSGDIVPQTDVAAMFVVAEVICGYIMLGGLISIFANKLAQRAH
jgi:hypothetical protein